MNASRYLGVVVKDDIDAKGQLRGGGLEGDGELEGVALWAVVLGVFTAADGAGEGGGERRWRREWSL